MTMSYHSEQIEIPKIFNFPKSLQLADGWIIRNLKEKHNSLIPDSLVKLIDQDTLGRLLAEIVGHPVEIVETNQDLIAWIK